MQPNPYEAPKEECNGLAVNAREDEPMFTFVTFLVAGLAWTIVVAVMALVIFAWVAGV